MPLFWQRLMLMTPLIWLMALSAHASAATLVVVIDGIDKIQGQICLSLFDQSEGFPGDTKQAIRSKCVEIKQTSMEVTFEQLALGRYAVAVIHDANQDNKLNTNFLGIPMEGFGFSGNPRILMGAPSFEDSAIQVGSDLTTRIQLQYLFGS